MTRVLRYIEECEWRQLLHYGEKTARSQGIGPEDVTGLVEEYRAEGRPFPGMRVVFDTNVIVSALNFPGNERLVLELAMRGRFDLCLSPFIPQEVSGVLTRKFGWTEERSLQALSSLGNSATVIDPPLLADAIEGGHADKPDIGMCSGRIRRTTS